MGMLRLFAFVMLLAVNLQVSVCLVLVLDKTVSEAYLSSVVVASHDVCKNLETGMAALPVGADYLPVDEMCACFNFTLPTGSPYNSSLYNSSQHNSSMHNTSSEAAGFSSEIGALSRLR